MKMDINGIRLAYDDIGKKTPVVVLLHGFGLGRSIWRDLAEAHLADYRVLLPDLRGHGESEAPTGAYAMTSLAQDLAGLLSQLEVERAVVCGHSMGGYVALAFAELYPQKLAGMGLITTNAAADVEDKRAGRYALIEQIKARGSIAVAESLAPRLSIDQSVIEQAHRMIKQSDPTGLIGSLQGMAERPDRTELLPEVHAPALVVAGEEDQITDYSASQAMAAVLPEGEFIGIPRAGHMPMFEAPAALGQALQGLLMRVENQNQILDHRVSN